ncbi:transcriptional activator NhaR [Pseudoalteromonas citrea]|uniref:LysR family transcriptional regulator, transcriptional activator of nhaA n=2 Tax=Pseudoalteromonas citrea TaxID=43655 RepID=A0A5S3XNM2_9GAMM|nr:MULTISPECIES: transcriptional activator NhaR [Pseudoalteromonas]KAF7764738.1 LysR family transcriptional regulator, transcriptional activator of nhaA [Pseudoalteromonas citrea]RJE72395.1 LysR family transcriptional regulator [Pseudoalteromonas sp. MSK9-3]TMP39922.1 transcriptional activator NhaR [Pseudoalteromonas citrea]TMP55732.1 transcriptional activator NhaR [Pseudoalteromonas citrea]
MITNINYNHLYYFWQVSKHGSIANASKVLHLTPQTVSAQITSLEQRLGKALFLREGRGLRLTEFGQITQQYADDMFAIAEEWLETTQGDLEHISRTLRVGISDALPKSLVSKWLSPFIENDRITNLHCVDGQQAELLAQMATHKLDLVLADKPLDSSLPFKAFCHEIGKSQLGFFGNKASLDTLKESYPQSLADVPVILPAKSSPMTSAIKYWLEEQGIEISIAGHVDDSALMKALGQQGFGLFAAPLLVKDEIERHYDVRSIGAIDNVYQHYYAFTPDRLIKDSIYSEFVRHAQHC